MEVDVKAITVERVIPAPAERIFDLLADPAGHARIDGSGSVRSARGGSRRLKLGDTFAMDMRIGLPYVSGNEVVELEENRRIAWRQRLGGQVWRYELEPVDGGSSTRVRETFDPSGYRLRFLLGPYFARRNGPGMEATLARIEELVTTT